METQQKIQELVQKLKNSPEVKNLLKHELLQDNVLIAQVDFDTDGKVYKGAQYEDKPETGVVLKVGKGRLFDNGAREASFLKEGDFVLFGKYSSVKVRIDGIDYLFVREDDIMSRYVG